MAKEGRKKLELYEVLASQKTKGKAPLGLEAQNTRQAPLGESTAETNGATDGPLRKTLPGVIIDDSINPGPVPQPPPQPARVNEFAAPDTTQQSFAEVYKPKVRELPPEYMPRSELRQEAEARPRSAKEVVFSVYTAVYFFLPFLVLLWGAYALGYKRGQEEKPTGLAGIGTIETTDPDRLGLRPMSLATRVSTQPPEQDYTLVLRTEPAGDDLPERLEKELAEAVEAGRRRGGGEFPSFIFRSGGNNPIYILTVGLGRTATDPELDKLLNIYYNLDGVTLSREPLPYRGARVAPVRELGMVF